MKDFGLNGLAMSAECLRKALLAKANGRRPVGRPRTGWIDYIENLGWIDYIENLGWNRLGEWWLNLVLLPRNPHGKAGSKKRRMI